MTLDRTMRAGVHAVWLAPGHRASLAQLFRGNVDESVLKLDPSRLAAVSGSGS